MAESVGAAARVAGINRRTPREKRDSLGRPTVIPERSEFRVHIVQVAWAIQVAPVVAAETEDRGHRPVTVTFGKTERVVVRDDAILEVGATIDTAATPCPIRPNRAVADRQDPTVVDSSSLASGSVHKWSCPGVIS